MGDMSVWLWWTGQIPPEIAALRGRGLIKHVGPPRPELSGYSYGLIIGDESDPIFRGLPDRVYETRLTRLLGGRRLPVGHFGEGQTSFEVTIREEGVHQLVEVIGLVRGPQEVRAVFDSLDRYEYFDRSIVANRFRAATGEIRRQRAMQRAAIEEALRINRGRKRQAARSLGIDVSTLEALLL